MQANQSKPIESKKASEATPVTVRLTPTEARVILRVIGNTSNFPDQIRSVCDTTKERNVAYRAEQKIKVALAKGGES